MTIRECKQIEFEGPCLMFSIRPGPESHRAIQEATEVARTYGCRTVILFREEGMTKLSIDPVGMTRIRFYRAQGSSATIPPDG